MTGIVDGMGGEEVNQAVTTTEIISGLNVFASSGLAAVVISGANIYATTSVQSANVVGTVVSGATVRSTLGIVQTTNIGSAYGAIIQTGSIATSAGSIGTIVFGRVFADTHYALVTGAYDAIVSGAYLLAGSKHTSGCEIIGEASSVYDYIAIGL